MFESIMWKYIDEETETLNSVINNSEIKNVAIKYKDIKNIYFVSHGSSYNAQYTVAPFFSKYAGVNCTTITAGNFTDEESIAKNIDTTNSLLVSISQTGNSRGTLLTCEIARKNNIKTLGLSASRQAKLAEYVDDLICLNCGEEKSNAKTKGYSCSVLSLIMFALELAKAKENISDAQYKEVLDDITREINSLKQTKEKSLQFCKDNDFGKELNNLYVFGCNMNYGSALECALKVTETACIPTVVCDTIEFSHGIHRSINPDCTLLIIRSGYNSKFSLDAFNYFKDKTKVFMINTLDKIDDKRVINIDNNSSIQSVLNIVEFIQIISTYAPENLGLDPNRITHNEFAAIVDTRI